MEKIVENGMLYDFYGPLLTRHQQEVMEMVVYHDMSLNEIAEAEGISKQAVSDLVKRVSSQMQGYEDKLHMIARFRMVKQELDTIEQMAHTSQTISSKAVLDAAERIRKEL